MEDSTPAAPSSWKRVVVLTREASVRIEFADGEPSIALTEDEARQVYSQLRKWYGRGK